MVSEELFAHMVMKVGLTGGIGSGKSTVAGMFFELGVPIIDADAIAHQIVASNTEVLQQIINKFGAEYLTNEHTLDRRKLKKIIFAYPASKTWLEQLLHPLISKEITKQAQVVAAPYCIVEIPLLIEAGLQNTVDRILIVDCPQELQLQRAMQRDKLTAAEVKKIIATQITRDKRLGVADDIIVNTGDLAYLKNEVRRLHNLYLEQSML